MPSKMDLDLSSLEGPPINDTRFTIQNPSPRRRYMNRNSDIPRVQVEHVGVSMAQCSPSHYGHGRGYACPPRPASADSMRPPQNKYNYPSRDRRAHGHTRNNHSSSDLLHPPTWPCGGHQSLDVSPSDSRLQSQRVYQLVWLENERIWAMVEYPSSTSTSSSSSSSNNLQPPRPTRSANSSPASPVLSTTLAAPPTITSPPRDPLPMLTHGYLWDEIEQREREYEGSEKEIEVPPSYNEHYYDRYVVPPMGSTARQSRWSEIARRINRAVG